MIKLNKIALAISVLCYGASAISHADTTDTANSVDFNRSWYIAPGVAAFVPDTRYGVDKNDVAASLRMGKPLSQYWDIQIGTTYGKVSNDNESYRQATLGVDALFLFSRDTVRPFLMAGGGVQRDKINTVFGDVGQNSGYADVGAGVQVVLGDQWALQLDYRRMMGLLRNAPANFPRSENNYTTLSVLYSFGKPEHAAVAEPTPEPMPVVTPPPTPTPVPPPPPPPAPVFEKHTLSAEELFAFNSAELRLPQPKLDDIATALNNNTNINNVTVAGYTDRIGSEKYNLKLSQRRAEAVRAYLISRGVDGGRLKAEGRGKADPIVNCDQKKRPALIACLQPNRRVEVEQITVERRVR